MPKVNTYPQASQAKALVLAKAVDSLGGTCSQAMAAEKIGMKPGGGFNVVVSAAAKYGFLVNKNGELCVTSLLRELNHAYSEEESAEFMRQSLLSVPLYKDLYERFKGRHLPLGMLDKLLIREMNVDQSWASKVTKYFIDDAKKCGLITDDNKVPFEFLEDRDDPEASGTEETNAHKNSPIVANEIGVNSGHTASPLPPLAAHSPEEFVISIKGPGMNTSIAINDEDDMVIVEATLNKIRRRLSTVVAQS